MGKNKELIWTVGIVLFLGVAGGGSYVWYTMQHNRHIRQLAAANTASEDTGQVTAGVNSNTNPFVIQDGSGAGNQQQSSSNTQSGGSQQVAGASTTGPSSDANKLLDPTSFAQYDKYKDNKDALFIDLQQGTGTAVASGNKVAVYYKGWLTNGTLFDQSQKGSDGTLQPFLFTEGQHEVIGGWEEAIFGMKQGGVRLFIVPPGVGYGANGQGPVPGNAVLIFQVQLVAVQ